MSSDLSGAAFEELVAEMIRRLGDDPEREGLKRTPERVAESLKFLTQGYGMKFEDVAKGALFEDCHRNMVLVKDIEMYSLGRGRAGGSGRRGGGLPPVHDDAGRAEAELENDHLRHAGVVSQRPDDARRVSESLHDRPQSSLAVSDPRPAISQ